jgi:hypothetical protein
MFSEVMIVYWLYGLTGMVYVCSTLCRFDFHTLQLLIMYFHCGRFFTVPFFIPPILCFNGNSIYCKSAAYSIYCNSASELLYLYCGLLGYDPASWYVITSSLEDHFAPILRVDCNGCMLEGVNITCQTARCLTGRLQHGSSLCENLKSYTFEIFAVLGCCLA